MTISVHVSDADLASAKRGWEKAALAHDEACATRDRCAHDVVSHLYEDGEFIRVRASKLTRDPLLKWQRASIAACMALLERQKAFTEYKWLLDHRADQIRSAIRRVEAMP